MVYKLIAHWENWQTATVAEWISENTELYKNLRMLLNSTLYINQERKLAEFIDHNMDKELEFALISQILRRVDWRDIIDYVMHNRRPTLRHTTSEWESQSSNSSASPGRIEVWDIDTTPQEHV